MHARGGYARLLARARRGDAAAAPMVGLVAAAVIYLLLFGALLNVTKDQEDTTKFEYRMLADRAESALHLMLSSTGEATNATANPKLTGAPDDWSVKQGTTATREMKDGRSSLHLVRSASGLALTSIPTPVADAGKYLVRATLHSTSSVDVVWYQDDDKEKTVRRDVAVVSHAAGSWATVVSGTLTAPVGAHFAELEVFGTNFWAESVALETQDARGWEWAPDGLVRFGLLEEDLASHPGFTAGRLPNVLDYNKLFSLRRGELDSRPNGGADYPSVLTATGLEGYNFHLRAHPVFKSLNKGFATDEAVQLAYLGHFLPSNTPAPATVTVKEIRYGATGEWVAFDLEVHNQGSASMLYRLTTTLTASAQQAQNVADNIHTTSIPANGKETITHFIRGMGTAPAWELGTKLDVKLSNAFSKELHSVSTQFVPPVDTANSFNIKIEPASTYFLENAKVEIFLDHFDDSGKRQNPGPKVDVEFRQGGALVETKSNVQLPKNKATSIECTQCGPPGEYTIKAWKVGDPGRSYEEPFEVVTDPPEQSVLEDVPSAEESSILTELIASYTNTVDRTAGCPADPPGGGTVPGDKYFDTKSGTEALADRLLRPDGSLCYHILIVGSSVEHTAMTSAKVKYGIRDWVYAGGTLVVLGSEDQSIQWMQPLSGTGLRSASGGIGAPDPTHPILNSPEHLAYELYRDPGTSWELKQKDEEDYTHVLVREQDQSTSRDMLAVSRPGVFGDGTVVLSAYMPYDLLPGNGPEEREEGKRFLHNMVTQAYASLYVDFGPPVPPHAPVASTERLSIVPHPLVPGALLEIRVVLYVFR